MIGIAGTLGKKMLSCAGYYRLRHRWSRGGNRKLVVLMYHDLVDDVRPVDRGPALRRKISRLEFDAHMEAVGRSFRVMTLEAAVKEIIEHHTLKKDTVAITFDDGYASVYQIACPVLRKYGFQATVYLATDWINGRMNFWWDRLTALVEQCRPEAINYSVIQEALGRHPLPSIDFTDIASVKSRLLKSLEDALRGLSGAEQTRILQILQTRAFPECNEPFGEPVALSWDEIKRLHGYGMVFGAHTCSHLNLSHADLLVAEKEIGGSKREIEQRIGSPVKGFAYPYGYDVEGYKRLVPLLKGLGFDYSCTASPGSNDQRSNLYLLSRDTLPPTASRALLRRELYLDFIS